MPLRKNGRVTSRDVLNVKVKVLSPGAIFLTTSLPEKKADKALRYVNKVAQEFVRACKSKEYGYLNMERRYYR